MGFFLLLWGGGGGAVLYHGGGGWEFIGLGGKFIGWGGGGASSAPPIPLNRDCHRCSFYVFRTVSGRVRRGQRPTAIGVSS